MIKKLTPILIAISLCLLVGFTAHLFQARALNTWYPTLTLPMLTPPHYVFLIVWSIIYVCIGISIGRLWDYPSVHKLPLTWLFIVQLFFNFLWSIGFFYLQSPLFGFIIILILDIHVLYYIFLCYKIDTTSARLFLPYAIWLAFATYLNLAIFLYN